MRIRPFDLRHLSLERHGLVRVELPCNRVMGVDRRAENTERDESERDSDSHSQPHSHRPTVFPSANFAPTKAPAGAPLSIGRSRIVTFAPGGNVDGRIPCRPS